MSKIILAAIAMAAIAAPAFAADAPAKGVSTAQVNFQSETQVTAFYAKIAIAAHAVCDSNSANPVVQQADRVCEDQAIARAVKTMNEPMLTSIYKNANGGADVRLAAR